jgi:DNA invertase Pin-like site-specific DNA recombinase
MIVGYGRVSTDGQTLDAQQSALRATAVLICATLREASVMNRQRKEGGDPWLQESLP